MLRPRESRDLRLLSSQLSVTPTPTITWAYDVFGNTVATATFHSASDSLDLSSVAEIQLDTAAWPVFDIAASAIVYPFRYSDDEWTFDPTNRSVGGANLIPVAVARDIRQATPVAGSFVGMSDAFLGMSVSVRVTSVPEVDTHPLV